MAVSELRWLSALAQGRRRRATTVARDDENSGPNRIQIRFGKICPLKFACRQGVCP